MPSFTALSAAAPSETAMLAPAEALAQARAAAPAHVPGYEILGELGRGGMGVVYKARHIALNRLVALKMILAGDHAGPDHLARFRAEAQALARLQHPHIVQVHEVGAHDGRPFFSLEYVEGGSLDRKLTGTPVPARQSAQMVETLARAMHAAHQAGVVHRDLKPANVLVGAKWTLKVTDFGLAKRLDEEGQTRTGTVIGTPSYMAPEQAGGKNKEVGPAADIYALGAILYQCLTGRPPFKAATAMETLMQVVQDEPVGPRQLQSRTPHDLETICLKCLQKDPRKRYATAEALAEDLRRFRSGEPILARPVGPAERLVKWVRRRPAVAALLAGLLAALTAGTAISAYFAVEATRRAHDADASASVAHDREQEAQVQKKAALDREREANEARAETEAALAHSLLAPLGSTGFGRPNDVETDALWELAQSRGDRVRQLFLEDALSSPKKARQLSKRRDMAVLAAVGLDPARRRALEVRLAAVVADEHADPGFRRDCALIATAIGPRDPACAAGVARILIEWTSRPTGNPLEQMEQLLDAATPLKVVVARLDHDGAVASLRVILDALGRKPGSMTNFTLGAALKAAAGRVPADEAARMLGDALAKNPNTDIINALEAVGGRLGRSAAASTARALADVCRRVGDTASRAAAARALATVLGRLPPDEARSSAAPVAAALANALALPPDGGTANLARGLAAILNFLPADEAVPTARRTAAGLAAAMGRPSSNPILPDLAQGLAAMLDRLPPAEAAAPARQGAQALAAALGKVGEQQGATGVAQALTALVRRLPADEAGAAAGQVIRTAVGLMVQIAGGPQPDGTPSLIQRAQLSTLSETVGQLATPLDPASAEAAADALADAMSKAGDDFLLSNALANGLAAVLDRMPADKAAGQAAKAALALADTIARNGPPPAARNSPFDSTPLRLLASHLDHDGATAVAQKLATQLADQKNPVKRDALYAALTAVQARLPAAEARPPAQSGADVARLVQAVKEAAPRDATTAAEQAAALAALLDQMPADRRGAAAGPAVEALADAVVRAADATPPPLELASALDAVARRLRPEKVATPVGRAAQALAASVEKRKADDPAQVLAANALAPLLQRLPPQEAASVAARGVRALMPGGSGFPKMPRIGVIGPTLTDLAPFLDRDGAAELVRWLVEEYRTTPSAQNAFQPLLHSLMGRLAPDEASRQSREILLAASELFGGVRIPCDFLNAADAAAVAAELTDRGVNQATAHLLEQVLTRPLRPEETAARLRTTAQAVAEAALPANRLGSAPAAWWAAQPLPGRFSAGQLIGLLKRPTCIGAARDAVLQRLGDECGRPFDDVGDFVEWAEANRPDLDLKSPPSRDGP